LIAVAAILLGVAALLLTWRLLRGPSVADRVIATDALLVTAMCAVLLASADSRTGFGVDTVLVVALLGFIATGVLARYIERRGNS
jgi:multisubunit Na+/H+ antiporter MnhF subunit